MPEKFQEILLEQRPETRRQGRFISYVVADKDVPGLEKAWEKLLRAA